ncbi:regulatory protein RecX [Sideroxyarcus emersonii]|uniref:Regulatory protein RecX n=1 Tax=Sideroxyarcus emersonii TaxID=2764705 RepID=A0AAN2BZF6_9PROT|nr:regulatory protein RecX [Sideroxyarcus emersonii]
MRRSVSPPWAQVKSQKKPELSLRVRAMRYLARREHSRAELHGKLLPYVQEGEDLGAVLDELEKKNWLSDARAATLLVDSKRGRFGTQRIAHELRQKGIAENLIADAIPQLKETELEAAREVWQRKFGTLPQDAREKARQIRFLQSRGFSIDVTLKVLKQAPGMEAGED